MQGKLWIFDAFWVLFILFGFESPDVYASMPAQYFSFGCVLKMVTGAII